MPTTASTFARTFATVCRAVALVVLLAPIVLVPHVEAQSVPPSHSAHPPEHDHSGASGTVQSVSKARFTPLAAGNTRLTGPNEVPVAGDPDGIGTAQVQINLGTAQVCVTIGFANIAAPTLGHIHRGAVGVAGPVVVDLTAIVTGSGTGCVASNPILLAEIISNPAGFYVNIHNADFPAGAIRGQVVLNPPTNLQATLTGPAEVPVTGDPDGTGFAGVSVDLDTNQVCVTLSVSNIEAATLAHIHEGAIGVAGPVVVNLPVPTSGSATGCATGLSANLVQSIIANPAGFYVNVHNVPFPGGAVRGQLSSAPPITHVAALTGAAEFPGPGDADGIGLATLTIDVPNLRICVATIVANIAPATLAHIHAGAAGTAGAIVVNLPVPTSGSVVGCVENVNAVTIAAIDADPGSFYVNIHNGDFVNGAIRGQLAAVSTQVGSAEADLELVSKVDTPDPVAAGQPLTYTLTVRNNGPDLATNVQVTDTLPAGVTFASATPNPACSNAAGTVTCNLGSLAMNAQAVVTIVVTPGAAGTLNNTASVSTGIADINIGNNSATATTTVIPAAANCAPRPAVRVTTQVVTENGVSRLRATIVAQTSAGTPANTLSSVQFTNLAGARVNVLPSGPTNQTAAFTHNLAAGSTQLQIDVFRTAAGQAATVRFIAIDSCGTWPSFVGAGPGVAI